jgi:hypothetical protein
MMRGNRVWGHRPKQRVRVRVRIRIRASVRVQNNDKNTRTISTRQSQDKAQEKTR